MSCSQSFPCSFTFFLSFYSEIHSIKKHVNIYWIMNTVQLCQYGVPTLFQHFELLYWTITNTYFFMLYLTWHFLIHFSYHCFSCLWQRIELCHIPQLNHSNSKRFQQKPNYLNLYQLMNSLITLVLLKKEIVIHFPLNAFVEWKKSFILINLTGIYHSLL